MNHLIRKALLGIPQVQKDSAFFGVLPRKALCLNLLRHGLHICPRGQFNHHIDYIFGPNSGYGRTSDMADAKRNIGCQDLFESRFRRRIDCRPLRLRLCQKDREELPKLFLR